MQKKKKFTIQNLFVDILNEQEVVDYKTRQKNTSKIINQKKDKEYITLDTQNCVRKEEETVA